MIRFPGLRVDLTNERQYDQIWQVMPYCIVSCTMQMQCFSSVRSVQNTCTTVLILSIPCKIYRNSA